MHDQSAPEAHWPEYRAENLSGFHGTDIWCGRFPLAGETTNAPLAGSRGRRRNAWEPDASAALVRGRSCIDDGRRNDHDAGERRWFVGSSDPRRSNATCESRSVTPGTRGTPERVRRATTSSTTTTTTTTDSSTTTTTTTTTTIAATGNTGSGSGGTSAGGSSGTISPSAAQNTPPAGSAPAGGVNFSSPNSNQSSCDTVVSEAQCKARTFLFTTVEDASNSPILLFAPLGTVAHDTADLIGADKPTGTVTYSLFANALMRRYAHHER